MCAVWLPVFAAAVLAGGIGLAGTAHAGSYLWPHTQKAGLTLKASIAPPKGFVRVRVAQNSFAHWLRGLPMKPRGAKVMLHNGAPKWRQDVHVAVVDIDVGRRDLQQCADAVMRLRAEYLLSTNRQRDISFNDTGSAKPISYTRWAKGDRPRLKGKLLRWSRRARRDGSYRNFRKYMTLVFAYAGTYSLAKELRQVALQDMQIGDVFIKGGFPGHAVLVADMVENRVSGERRFLLLQSFMPAQDIHVLKKPAMGGGNGSITSPWYAARFVGPLITPEWTFAPGSLKRWN